MLLFLPLALAEQLQHGAVDHQVPRPVWDATRAPPGKATAAPAQGGVVGHGEIESEQPEHAADKALDLAQGEAEDQPEHQDELDR